jgi:hypothetical protein
MRLSTFILAAALAAGAVAKPANLSQRSNPTPQYASVTSSGYPSASSRAPSESNSTANNQDLINKLELAATAVDRIALITDDHDFVYDFLNPPPDGAITAGKGTAIFP